MHRLLLLEDDPRLSDQLTRSFAAEHFQVTPVQDLEAFDAAVNGDGAFDLVVLDRMIGAHDAKSRLPAVKKRWPGVPVMVLLHLGPNAIRARSIPCSAVMPLASASSPSAKNRLSPALGRAPVE